jgi:hypothetical protein
LGAVWADGGGREDAGPTPRQVGALICRVTLGGGGLGGLGGGGGGGLGGERLGGGGAVPVRSLEAQPLEGCWGNIWTSRRTGLLGHVHTGGVCVGGGEFQCPAWRRRWCLLFSFTQSCCFSLLSSISRQQQPTSATTSGERGVGVT